MFSLEIIKNIEKQSFFKNAVYLKNELDNAILNKKAKNLFKFGAFLFLNTFLSYFTYNIHQVRLLNPINLDFFNLYFPLLLIFLGGNLFVFGILEPYLYKFLNIKNGANKANEIIDQYGQSECLYNLSKIKNIDKYINLLNNEEKKNIKQFFSIVHNCDLEDKNTLMYELLQHRINFTDEKEII